MRIAEKRALWTTPPPRRRLRRLTQYVRTTARTIPPMRKLSEG